jgi:5'-methylthioadenosine phosphorylase
MRTISLSESFTPNPDLELGVIGGSGFYKFEGVKVHDRMQIETPYGPTSDPIVIGLLEGEQVVFLPRHGTGHWLLPHSIPYQANIWAMRRLGVKKLISVTAVGSMLEKIKPGHLVLVDQLVDSTHQRRSFFENGIVAHVQFDQPICSQLRSRIIEIVDTNAMKVHPHGTLDCIAGPHFSTLAQSRIRRGFQNGGNNIAVVGMTNWPEARLAREAELCFATIALSTDFDSWKEDEEPVTVEIVVRRMKENVYKAQSLIRRFVQNHKRGETCNCNNALQGTIMTNPKVLRGESAQEAYRAMRKKLDLFVGSYLPVIGEEGWQELVL